MHLDPGKGLASADHERHFCHQTCILAQHLVDLSSPVRPMQTEEALSADQQSDESAQRPLVGRGSSTQFVIAVLYPGSPDRYPGAPDRPLGLDPAAWISIIQNDDS